jgi:hypothetical protein
MKKLVKESRLSNSLTSLKEVMMASPTTAITITAARIICIVFIEELFVLKNFQLTIQRNHHPQRKANGFPKCEKERKYSLRRTEANWEILSIQLAGNAKPNQDLHFSQNLLTRNPIFDNKH